MAIIVILILAVLWAAVLVPPILRSRSEGGGGRGHGHGGWNLGDLAGRLGSLGRRSDSGPLRPLGSVGPTKPIVGPMAGMAPLHIPGSTGMSPAQKRRRDVLLVLGGATAFAFLMALVGQSMVFWVLFLFTVMLLGGYVLLLLQMKQRAAEQRAKVRHLDQARPIQIQPQAQFEQRSLVTVRRTGTH